MRARPHATGLIGREAELDALEDALLAAAQGEGRTVVLSAEAGLGKTRLAAELAGRAMRLGTVVLSGACSEADLALPYLPFVEAIGNHLATRDPVEVASDLGPAARELGRLFPELGEPPADPSDPGQGRLRLFEAIITLLRDACRHAGVLLVVEDAHWADASTRELLDYLVRRARTLPLLLLVTVRIDELHRRHPLLPLLTAWRRAGSATEIALDPLDRRDVGELLREMFEYDRPVSAEFRDLCWERSEGNPFVLEELLKAAIDRGDLYRSAEGWERREMTDLAIPASLADSVLMRIARLPGSGPDVADAAAVLGRAFDYDVLVAITEPGVGQDDVGHRRDVLGALETLVDEQVVEPDGTPGHYRFRHSLTREVVYDALILPRRQALHERAAAVAPTALEHAHHLFAAGRPEAAVPYCLEAAEDAIRGSAPAEAVELFERAMPYVHEPLERGRLARRLGEALVFLGATQRAQPWLEDAVGALAALGHPIETAETRLALGRVYWEQGVSERAVAEFEAARVVLEPLGPSEALAIAYVRLASMAVFAVDGERGRELAERAIEIATTAGAEMPRIWAENFLGVALDILAQPDAAITHLERSYAEAEAHGYSYVAGNALHNLAEILIYAERLDAAERVVQELDRRRAEGPTWEMSRFVTASGLLLARGDLEGLVENARDARRFFAHLGNANFERSFRHLEAWGLVELGRIEEAELPDVTAHGIDAQNLTEWVLSRVRYHQVRGDMVAVRRTVDEAVAVWRPGDPMLRLHLVGALAALGDVQGAHDLAHRPEGARPWAAPDRAALGWVALLEGDPDLAARELQAAAGMFDRAGVRLEAARVRVPWAQAVHARNQDEAAAAILQDALDGARACRAAVLEQEIRGVAAALRTPLETRAEAPPVTVPDAASEHIVTVLFADVRGYTPYAAKAAPAELASRMATLYRWARRDVEHRGGLVERYEGDAVMAAFNLRRPTLEHAADALDAALALVGKAALTDLPVGIGIASGPAVVGRMTGSEDVSVLGETTNLAARLQAQAAPGEVLLSSEAYRRARERLEERRLEAEARVLSLKGIDDPVTAYVVRNPIATS